MERIKLNLNNISVFKITHPTLPLKLVNADLSSAPHIKDKGWR